jgi:hypothetical protein
MITPFTGSSQPEQSNLMHFGFYRQRRIFDRAVAADAAVKSRIS